ncbi:MAG: tetratricopeptide repeat protein, partial [Pseudomonadota bacterium]
MRRQCNKTAAVGLALVLLAGCASTAPGPEAADPAEGGLSAQAPSADDLDPDLLFHALAAERLGAAGNYIEAYGHAHEAALLSDNPDLARQAVSLAMRVGNWEGVTTSARRWRQLDEESSAAEQLIVLGLMNQAEFESAARELAPILRAAEDRAEAWREVTLLIASAERDDNALAVMDALVERMPETDESQVLESRSLLLWQMGRPEEAFELARSAAEGSEDTDRLIWAAQLAAANDDFEAALELYQNARAVDPDNARLALAQAEVLRQMDREADAIELLRTVPESTATLYSLGLYQYEAEDLEGARQSW